MRRAFTLVELLVAIVVLSVGLLALAATAGLVAGHLDDGERLTSAAHAARSVLDSLLARPCDALESGGATGAGVAVRWRIDRDSAAARVEVTVVATLRRREQSATYDALVPCAVL